MPTRVRNFRSKNVVVLELLDRGEGTCEVHADYDEKRDRWIDCGEPAAVRVSLLDYDDSPIDMCAACWDAKRDRHEFTVHEMRRAEGWYEQQKGTA